MKGRAAATLLTICFSVTFSFSQLRTMDNGFGSRGANLGATNISGVVVGMNGKAQADVRVEVRSEQTGNAIASGYTNNGGGFEFDGLPTAPYDIVALKGLSESHQHLAPSELGVNLRIRLNDSDPAAARADGNATVSIAEYRVPEKARNALHKAQEALAKNRPEEVSKQLTKALEIDPDYAAALTLRGVLSLDSRNPQLAINDFDKAIHSDPGFSMAYTAMAAALNQLKKFDDALRSADRAIALAPRSWQSYFEMAKSYVGKSDYAHALPELAKAQQLNPTDYAPIHLLRANVLLAVKNYADAINELQAFLTLAPAQDPDSGRARAALEKLKAFTASAANPAVATAR